MHCYFTSCKVTIMSCQSYLLLRVGWINSFKDSLIKGYLFDELDLRMTVCNTLHLDGNFRKQRVKLA